MFHIHTAKLAMTKIGRCQSRLPTLGMATSLGEAASLDKQNFGPLAAMEWKRASEEGTPNAFGPITDITITLL